jgi:dienelactone hydrolase
MAAYLFIPAKVRPPYQTVVFFPSARVLDLPDSKTLGDMKFIAYAIQSGRAVLYPVYKGTYERQGAMVMETPAAQRDTLIQDGKDLSRSMDFLATRADIDQKRIGYLGVSMGAAWGVIFGALEPRLRSIILLDGGFFEGNPLPGMDQADFAPRITAPVLMIGGKYDWVFLGKDALFPLLGTPAADKKSVLFDTAHDVSEQKSDLVREVVAWLDRCFGRVQ